MEIGDIDVPANTQEGDRKKLALEWLRGLNNEDRLEIWNCLFPEEVCPLRNIIQDNNA